MCYAVSQQLIAYGVLGVRISASLTGYDMTDGSQQLCGTDLKTGGHIGDLWSGYVRRKDGMPRDNCSIDTTDNST